MDKLKCEMECMKCGRKEWRDVGHMSIADLVTFAHAYRCRKCVEPISEEDMFKLEREGLT